MFKAYFYLSMELVRDVVKALEEEMMENFDDEASKPVSASFTAPIPTSHRRPSSYQKDKSAAAAAGAGPSAAGTDGQEPGQEEMWPVMEAMSQDAIEEMVEKTFNSANTSKNGKISFDEFRRFVQNDSTMIAWFDALGSIF